MLIHRVEFLTRNQTDESPLDYISTMRKLAQYADLANLSPDLILASRIISGAATPPKGLCVCVGARATITSISVHIIILASGPFVL